MIFLCLILKCKFSFYKYDTYILEKKERRKKEVGTKGWITSSSKNGTINVAARVWLSEKFDGNISLHTIFAHCLEGENKIQNNKTGKYP